MLCSRCSEQVKPVVAIDIDGTLGDYHSHFLRFASEYTGYDIPSSYDGGIKFKDWFLSVMADETERSWRDIKLAYRQGAMKRSMPSYVGAANLCQEVREAGAELWLTTTRPYLRLDNVDPDTRAWLDRQEIEFDGLLYDDAKYERLAERVEPERVVAVVDDLPDMWEAAARLFGWQVPILRRTRFNRAVKCGGEQCSESLFDIAEMIRQRITEWRSTHE